MDVAVAKVLVKTEKRLLDAITEKLGETAKNDIEHGHVLVVVNGKIVNPEEIDKKTVKPNDIILLLPKLYGG